MSRKFRRFLWLSAVAAPFACSIPDERQTQNDGETQGGNAGAHSQPSAGVNTSLGSSLGGAAIWSSTLANAATVGGNRSPVSSAAPGATTAEDHSTGSGVRTDVGTGGTSPADANAGGAPIAGSSTPPNGALAAGGTGGLPSTGVLALGGTSSSTNSLKGGAQQIGLRDCSSTGDNNNNQIPDRDEPECACKTANEVRSCAAPSGVGVCKQGTQSCVIAADRTSSSWSTCAASSAHGRDCLSSADNDCNGTADNAESPCALCGQPPRACDAHAGYDGVGECHAGTQAVVVAADRSKCTWGSCTGSQGPTTEKCGLSADGRLLDTNCNGKPGDGEYDTVACLNPSPFYLFRIQYNASNFVPLLYCKVTVTALGPHGGPGGTTSTCHYYQFEKCSDGTIESTVGYALRPGGSVGAPSAYRQLAVPKGSNSCTAISSANTAQQPYPQSPMYADSCSNCTPVGLYVLPSP